MKELIGRTKHFGTIISPLSNTADSVGEDHVFCVIQVAHRFEVFEVFPFLAIQIYNGVAIFSCALQGKRGGQRVEMNSLLQDGK